MDMHTLQQQAHHEMQLYEEDNSTEHVSSTRHIRNMRMVRQIYEVMHERDAAGRGEWNYKYTLCGMRRIQLWSAPSKLGVIAAVAFQSTWVHR